MNVAVEDRTMIPTTKHHLYLHQDLYVTRFREHHQDHQEVHTEVTQAVGEVVDMAEEEDTKEMGMTIMIDH